MLARVLRHEEVDVRREEAEQLVLEALAEEAQVDAPVRVGREGRCERDGIAYLAHRLDMGAKAPALVVRLEQMQRLGRVVDGAGVLPPGIGGGQEVRHQRDDIEQQHDDAAKHREPVSAEAPPHQLPLRGGGHLLGGALLGRQGGGVGGVHQS